MTEHAFNSDFTLKKILERLDDFDKRLKSLESHERSESKLNEIQARQVWKDLERGPPEHKAEVERRVADMMKELKEC
jgi:hypothetical protein